MIGSLILLSTLAQAKDFYPCQIRSITSSDSSFTCLWTKDAQDYLCSIEIDGYRIVDNPVVLYLSPDLKAIRSISGLEIPVANSSCVISEVKKEKQEPPFVISTPAENSPEDPLCSLYRGMPINLHDPRWKVSTSTLGDWKRDCRIAGRDGFVTVSTCGNLINKIEWQADSSDRYIFSDVLAALQATDWVVATFEGGVVSFDPIFLEDTASWICVGDFCTRAFLVAKGDQTRALFFFIQEDDSYSVAFGTFPYICTEGLGDPTLIPSFQDKEDTQDAPFGFSPILEPQSNSVPVTPYSTPDFFLPSYGTIICNDGTLSPTCKTCDSGCCSYHGGCQYKNSPRGIDKLTSLRIWLKRGFSMPKKKPTAVEIPDSVPSCSSTVFTIRENIRFYLGESKVEVFEERRRKKAFDRIMALVVNMLYTGFLEPWEAKIIRVHIDACKYSILDNEGDPS